MKHSLARLKVIAADFKPGFEAAVLAASVMDGKTFEINPDDYQRIGEEHVEERKQNSEFRIQNSEAAHSIPYSVFRIPYSNAEAESACLSCVGDSGFFQPETNRCMHPKCGCPAGTDRREPWKNLKQCPEKKWPAAAPRSAGKSTCCGG